VGKNGVTIWVQLRLLSVCFVTLLMSMLVLHNMGRVCLHAAEDEARVKQVWAEGNDGKHVVAQPLACHIKSYLTSRNLQTTKHGQWINDEVINYYHAVLQQRQPHLPGALIT
jgi:hypothetical protein